MPSDATEEQLRRFVVVHWRDDMSSVAIEPWGLTFELQKDQTMIVEILEFWDDPPELLAFGCTDKRISILLPSNKFVIDIEGKREEFDYGDRKGLGS